MNDKLKVDEFKDIDEFKTIQDLLDKYMDGATSNEEEATLRKYFEEHGNDIPEEWESYRALFSYIGFEQMNLSQILKEEEKEEDFEKKDIEKEELPKKEASRSRWLKYFGTSVAAAAIIAFLIVGIQKIAQPRLNVMRLSMERFIPTRSSFITKPWMPWKMFRQIPKIHSVPWI